MKLTLRLRIAAVSGAAAVGIFSGCLTSRPHSATSRHDEGPEVFNSSLYGHSAASRPAEAPELILPAPAASFPDQEFPPGGPPALPPANDEEPVPSAGLSRIRPISYEVPCGSCQPSCSTCCAPCPTTCCDPCSSGCSDSLFQKIQRELAASRYKMSCFKSKLKCDLARLNPLNGLGGCGTCSTCDVSCGSCCDDVVLDGVVTGEYPVSGFPACSSCQSGSTYGVMPGQWQQPVWNGPPPYQPSMGYNGPPPCNCQKQTTWQAQAAPAYGYQSQYPPQSFTPRPNYGPPQYGSYSQPANSPQYAAQQPQYAPQQPQYAPQQPQYAPQQPQYAPQQPQYAPQQAAPQYDAPDNVGPQPVPQVEVPGQTRYQPGHAPLPGYRSQVLQTGSVGTRFR